VLADAGFRVTGYDVNDEFLTRVTTTGRAGYIEDGLDELLARTLRGRLTLSSSPPGAHDVYIITVGTPLDPATGRPTIDKVRQAISQLAPRFGPDPLVILRSTVTIGTSRAAVLPEVARHTARFGLAFCPERTIEGKAIAEMKSLPQIVGGLDEQSADRAEAVFRAITDKIVRVSSLEAAEMIKLMNNTYRDLTFAFANEMALMAERLGLTASELIGAANLDYPRSNIARPGFVGGPCLEKDALILIDSLGRLDFRLGVVQAARELNARLPDQVADRVLAELTRLGRGAAGARVVISGFAFKGAPATEDVRGSAAVPVMERLQAAGIEVWGHDFVTPEKVIADLGAHACTLEEGCAGADEQPSGLWPRRHRGAGPHHARARARVRQLEPLRGGALHHRPRRALRRHRHAVHLARRRAARARATRRVNVLFLCHRLPFPPKRGGKIRPFNMIRRLAREHRVTVATVARTREEMREGEGLRSHCHELHVGLVTGRAAWSRFALAAPSLYPSTFAYFYSPVLWRTVRGLLARGRFDAIVVHCSSMGPYVADHTGCRKVMDFGDADSEKWLEYSRRARLPLSLGFRWEGYRVRRWERALGERFDACSVISTHERDVLARHVERPIAVIPNGVDLEYFRPRPGVGAPHPKRIVFTGNMSYAPNVDAVRHLAADVLPRLRQRVPDVELFIVGMDPSPAVRRLADPGRVVVTGRVDDVRPFLESAAVSVAPLRIARGLQNKVLEAMAMRVPVVASSAAARGIEAVPDRDLLVADDADGFAGAVAGLLAYGARRERYAEAGRACVTANHDWDRLLARLDGLLAVEPRVSAGPERGVRV
jgi:sugar transferase (PEP-CTERM/EpsH1 system associated)